MSSFSRCFTVHVSDSSSNNLLNGGHVVELDLSGQFEDALAQWEIDMHHRALVQVKQKPFANSPQADHHVGPSSRREYTKLLYCSDIKSMHQASWC